MWIDILSLTPQCDYCSLLLLSSSLLLFGLGWTDARLYSAILRSLEQTHCARMFLFFFFFVFSSPYSASSPFKFFFFVLAFLTRLPPTSLPPPSRLPPLSLHPCFLLSWKPFYCFCFSPSPLVFKLFLLFLRFVFRTASSSSLSLSSFMHCCYHFLMFSFCYLFRVCLPCFALADALSRHFTCPSVPLCQ